MIMTILKLFLALSLFSVGFLFILAIVGGKKCPHCNRNVQENGGDCVCDEETKGKS